MCKKIILNTSMNHREFNSISVEDF